MKLRAGILSIEHGRAAYLADFVLYGLAAVVLGAAFMVEAPRQIRVELTLLSSLGLVGWTAIEYLLHRFVLHVIPPFKRWHDEHHRRPMALIGTPTLMSAALIVLVVFAPLYLFAGMWRAIAVTQGFVTGYWLYAIAHHASHHWRASGPCMKQQKRRHALHHRDAMRFGGYGVTSGAWDHVFGTAPSQLKGKQISEPNQGPIETRL